MRWCSLLAEQPIDSLIVMGQLLSLAVQNVSGSSPFFRVARAERLIPIEGRPEEQLQCYILYTGNSNISMGSFDKEVYATLA